MHVCKFVCVLVCACKLRSSTLTVPPSVLSGPSSRHVCLQKGAYVYVQVRASTCVYLDGHSCAHKIGKHVQQTHIAHCYAYVSFSHLVSQVFPASSVHTINPLGTAHVGKLKFVFSYKRTHGIRHKGTAKMPLSTKVLFNTHMQMRAHTCKHPRTHTHISHTYTLLAYTHAQTRAHTHTHINAYTSTPAVRKAQRHDGGAPVHKQYPVSAVWP